MWQYFVLNSRIKINFLNITCEISFQFYNNNICRPFFNVLFLLVSLTFKFSVINKEMLGYFKVFPVFAAKKPKQFWTKCKFFMGKFGFTIIRMDFTHVSGFLFLDQMWKTNFQRAKLINVRPNLNCSPSTSILFPNQ